MDKREEKEEKRNQETIETTRIIPSEKGDSITMQEMQREPKTLNAQKVETISISVKTGKVYVDLERREEEKEKIYKMVEPIQGEQEELQVVEVMGEKKIALLKKHIPEFEKVAEEVEKNKNEQALETYQRYLEQFQNVDPIVIHTLDKAGKTEAIKQYIEAVSNGEKEKMPFALEYDLRGMYTSDFYLAEKENMLSFAKANKKVARKVKGLRSAQRHIKIRKFEKEHRWFGKMMTWLRAEEEPKALAAQNEVIPTKNESIVKEEKDLL